MKETEMELPKDVLADVLRRLPPRAVAVSRCVCKAWCAAVDDGRLLRRDLLPLSVGGLYLRYQNLDYPAFLSRPSTGPAVSGHLDFLLSRDISRFAHVLDHCNGLLLYKDSRGLHVVNPATRRWARLPPPPRLGNVLSHVARLVVDPADSPHYEVFLVPDDPAVEELDERIRRSRAEPPAPVTIITRPRGFVSRLRNPLVAAEKPSSSWETWEREDDGSMEWPASACTFCRYSSRTGRWEERAFAREGDAAGTAADLRLRRQKIISFWHGHAAYYRGALYVHCNGGEFVLRLSFSSDKYSVIKMPLGIEENLCSQVCLGRSREGVSCALIHDWYNLRVWILDESCAQTQWVLKHQIDLRHSILRVFNFDKKIEGPWVLQDVNNDEDDYKKAPAEDFEWNSDDDSFLDTEVEHKLSNPYVSFLGFHPYKDVVFFDAALRRALAYHLNSSMIQDLGNVHPKYYSYIAGTTADITESFPYTPCWMTDFPENNSS